MDGALGEDQQDRPTGKGLQGNSAAPKAGQSEGRSLDTGEETEAAGEGDLQLLQPPGFHLQGPKRSKEQKAKPEANHCQNKLWDYQKHFHGPAHSVRDQLHRVQSLAVN
jgi:hypothetical protein